MLHFFQTKKGAASSRTLLKLLGQNLLELVGFDLGRLSSKCAITFV
jgi:hypothetical protein